MMTSLRVSPSTKPSSASHDRAVASSTMGCSSSMVEAAVEEEEEEEREDREGISLRPNFIGVRLPPLPPIERNAQR